MNHITHTKNYKTKNNSNNLKKEHKWKQIPYIGPGRPKKTPPL